MAEGFRTFDRGNNIMRPIIPTPYSIPSGPNIADHQSKGMLNHIYETYLRLVREQNILNNQINIVNKEKQDLSEKFDIMKSENEKRKRHRRTADEIKREFDCPIKSCGKSYGSDGSLLQHIKLKHYQFYQSEEYEHLLLEKQKKKVKENADKSQQQG